MSRLHDRLKHAEPAVGTIMLAHGEEWVELLGYAGLDFICIDMMVTSLDWSEVASMVRAANRYGMTTWVRLPAYPWDAAGEPVVDTALPAQALRAYALGADCVLASINSGEDARRLLEPIKNPHRRFYIRQGLDGQTADQRAFDDAEPTPMFVPIIESAAAIGHIDEILATPGLRMVYLGMGDLTREVGHPGDEQHPEVRALVADIAAKARAHGVAVAANTLGYRGSGSLSGRITDGVRSLREVGVSVTLLPRPTMVVQHFYEGVLAELR